MSDTPEEPIVEQPAEEPKLLGDVVSDVLDAMGGKTVAALIERVTKKPCNCGQRAQRLNAIDQAGREKYRAMATQIRDLINGNETK